MELITKRLILRPWRESDADALYKYASSPQIGPSAGWQPHISVEDSRQIIHDILSAPESYAVVLKETNEPVGSIGLIAEKNSEQMKDNDTEIGYWIGVPYWGQGLIPEAVHELIRHSFEDLGYDTIWCGYYDGNEKSKRVQDKCGFRYHHTEINKPVPLLNEARTAHFTRITKEEWERKPNTTNGTLSKDSYPPYISKEK